MDPTQPMTRALSLCTNIVQSRLCANLGGCLDAEAVPQLQEMLDGALTDLSAGIAREFEFDTSQLYLLSSSAISCLAGWVKAVTARFPGTRITFRTNANLAWQRRAIEPIRRLAPAVVAIE